MKAKIKIENIDDVKAYVNNKGKTFSKEFQAELIRRSKALALKMQEGLNASVDRGAVPFTKRAISFYYRKSAYGVECTIFVRPNQADYLYDVIVDSAKFKKIVPNSRARLTAQGNIPRLKSNLASGKYKIINSGGKQRLIDTTKKGKTENARKKRLIGIRESKRRKIIYDFYKEGEEGFMAIISTINGTFKIKRG